MPEKITSKNLSYNSSLPPFLQRLHAQAGGASGPDPMLAAQKRSAKKRSSSEEAEDAPLVVDEHGNRVNIQLERDGTVREVEGEAVPAKADDDGDDDDVAPKPDEKTKTTKDEPEKNSSIGGRKRKVGKIIGQDSSPLAGVEIELHEKRSVDMDNAQVDRKVKKKAAKKIKLSFDEEEDEG